MMHPDIARLVVDARQIEQAELARKPGFFGRLRRKEEAVTVR